MPKPEIKIVKFSNIEEIKNHKFAGNHFFDCGSFTGIENFVLDGSNSIADRAEALRIMSDKGMGCGREEHLTDAALVNMCLQEWS